MSTPRGYVKFLLGADVETSGLAFNQPDPSFDPVTGETFQIVSIGLVVTDFATLKEIETLYLEIKWNGESTWSQKAQDVHGLSLAYLEANGIEEEEAAVQIAQLILKYWGPNSPVSLLGHNVATFDKPFIDRLLKKFGINVRYGSKHIDTNSVGAIVFGTHNSDDLFETVGLPPRDPSKHNALIDAQNAVAACRSVRQLSTKCFEE